jgi:hypothetical protein
MNTEKEMVALLREIRDYVQILVAREQLPPVSPDLPEQRNVRSWLLWGHRTHPRTNHLPDDTAPADH